MPRKRQNALIDQIIDNTRKDTAPDAQSLDISALRRSLVRNILPYALTKIEQIVRSGSLDGTPVPIRERVMLLRDILDRGGLGAPRAPEAPRNAADGLADLSLEQLRELVDHAENERANRAKIIDAPPNGAQDDVNPFD